MASFVHAAWSQTPLRFEAETVTEPKDAWEKDRFSETKWNLWSTDKDADKKWSGGIVLQSPRVLKDRDKPEDGAPPLHTVVKDLKPGKYYVEVGGVGRPMGISFDGKTWKKIDGGSRNLGLLEIKNGTFELWLDDRYAAETGQGSTYYDFLAFTPLPDPNRKPKVAGFAKARVEEKLDRGVVALPMADGKVYVGWRLLKDDPKDIGFNVYRRVQGREQKLNDAPVLKTTDFVDEQPVAGAENEYLVRPVVTGREQAPSPPAKCTPADELRSYVSFKLNGDHAFQKCGIADLNGDGAYDFVLKQPNVNIDPADSYWQRSPETYKVEAYLNDGTFLWRHDLGWAVERGIWYSPMVVHDLDGDGKAEVCLKTGEGDPRDQDGRVQSGPEYVTILDGMTGKPLAQTDWPKREDFPNYNYSSRNQMCVAYLDGKTPCLIVERGTYNVIEVLADQFHDGKLTEVWRWSDAEEGGRYRGQGAHSMHAADIDGDGRDEVFLGSAVLDDNGCGLWSTGLGHPDHHYVGDIDPSRPGLEVYYGIETRQSRNGCCLVDAKTGDLLWGLDQPTTHGHSTGTCADIDPTHPGLEAYSADSVDHKPTGDHWLWSCKGEVLSKDVDYGFGTQTVYWDADLQRELIRGKSLVKFRGGSYPNVLEGSVVGFADVFGDWREELIVSVPGELRVYSTTIPARDRRVCLMQDPIYRMDVCLQAMGYTQCPMTTECLSAGEPSVSLVLPEGNLKPNGATAAQIVAVAPATAPMRGAVRLEAADGVAASPSEVQVTAKSGEVVRYPLTLIAAGPGPLLSATSAPLITLSYQGTGEPIRSKIALRVEDLPRTDLPRVQAEAFSAQGGGEVQLRDDKVGADGKCFSHWDKQGHWLEWQVNAPKDGNYCLVLRYCSPAGVKRQVAVDGKALCGDGPQFSATGGFSAEANDWAHACPRDPHGKPVSVRLTRGEHCVRLTNVDGQGMNVDYLLLVPAPD